MAPSTLFAPAQEEQNVRMIHLSRDDDLRKLEARKGITRMRRLMAIRSQLQLAQAALDQAIKLVELSNMHFSQCKSRLEWQLIA